MKLLVGAYTLSNGQFFDYFFINADTDGFREFLNSLNDYSVYELVIQSGVELSKIQQVFDFLAVHNKIVVC
jgi:predicted molibdopterin-dependent oxidoreductase YjgC